MKEAEYLKMFNLEDSYWWYKGLHHLTEIFVHRHFLKKNKLTILDAGCGTGGMLAKLQKYGVCYGFDFSMHAVTFSKKRSIENVTCQDLNNWQPPHKMFDVIICNDVLYHAAIDDEKEILRKFNHALTDNGILIIDTAAFRFLYRHHDEQVQGKRRHTLPEFKKYLQEASFRISSASYRHPLLFLIIAIEKLIRKPQNNDNQDDSDLKPLNKILNFCLYTLHLFENTLIKWGFFIPFGSSLFLVSYKKLENE